MSGSGERTWEAAADGWLDGKENPAEPDWMYEARIPPNAGMFIAAKAQYRRLPAADIERIVGQRTKAIDAGRAAWVTMRRFNEHAHCVKCGNDRAVSSFRSADELHFGGHEVIGRKCDRCDYVWHERPLDAELDEDAGE